MRKNPFLLACLTTLTLANALFADSKIDALPLAPAGKWRGFTLSPHNLHAAVLATKGSRFTVVIDGTEGPRIDQLYSPDGSAYFPPFANADITRTIPVLFSDDGTHYAYLAKTGNDIILISDGKEVARSPTLANNLNAGPLTLTPSGKHLYYTSSEGGYHVIMDGNPEPISHIPPLVVVGPKNDHYAYIGTLADGNDTPFGVVDGKQVKHFGDNLQFTAKGHLIAIAKGKGVMGLNLDGKIIMKAAAIQQLWLSPHGGMIAALVSPQPGAKSVLTVNNKLVPGTEGAIIDNVYFSPDDKHFAAVLSSPTHLVILDGKPGQTYDAINGGMPGMVENNAAARAWALGKAVNDVMIMDTAHTAFPAFTADSAHFLYVAQAGGKSFLVTDTDESDGYNVISPITSPDGKHIAFVADGGLAGKPATIFMDGKTITLTGRKGAINGGFTSLTFSPDGNHYVFTTGGVLYVDGVEQPNLNCNGLYLYSPDSQHLLIQGSATKSPNQYGLFLDGKPFATGDAFNGVTLPTFTPDSQHLFFIANFQVTTNDDRDNKILYLDGQPTNLKFHEPGLASRGNYQTTPDNTLLFTAWTADDLKRYTITPDPAVTLATVLAAKK